MEPRTPASRPLDPVTERAIRTPETTQDSSTSTDDVVPSIIGDEAANLRAVEAELPPFRAHNLIAVCDGSAEAREMIMALERAGIDASRISYVALADPETGEPTVPGHPEGSPGYRSVVTLAAPGEDETAHGEHRLDEPAMREVVGGTAKGASAGAVVGAAAGAALLLIPGIGTVAGAGILGAVLGGGAAGSALGGIWGAFSNAAESPAWERTFAQVRAGRALVGVHSDDADEIERVRPLLGDDLHEFDAEGRTIE